MGFFGGNQARQDILVQNRPDLRVRRVMVTWTGKSWCSASGEGVLEGGKLCMLAFNVDSISDGSPIGCK